MKICFVHRGRENFDIEYTAALLKSRSHQVELAYDPDIFGLEDNIFRMPLLEKIFSRRKDVVRTILKSDADIIAFLADTFAYMWALEIAREIKPKIRGKILFGGIHPTLVPGEVMKNDFIDYCVVGEGEYAVLELAESIESGQARTDINNIWFRSGSEILENPLRDPVKDLDELPMPRKKLFEKEINRSGDYEIITGRGCLYDCGYCCQPHLNRIYGGGFQRRRSVGSVIDELAFMKKKYSFKTVSFSDAVFFSDKKWFRELMERYIAEISVPFRCSGKACFIDDEVAHILKHAGCYCVEFGFQTLNEDTRKHILGRTETNDDIKNALDLCDKYGLRYEVEHVFGIPGESLDDHIDAVKFYSGRKFLKMVKCHNLTYSPKLEITRKALEAGYLSGSDCMDIIQGKTQTFFHKDTDQAKKMLKISRIFSKFMSFLPIIPNGITKLILQHKLYGIFSLVPSVIILFWQIAAAPKGCGRCPVRI